MEKWKLFKLGDLVSIKGGKRLPKGINLIKIANQHPYIRIRDLGKSKYLELDSSYEYVDDETYKSISRYIVNQGDIVLAIVGNTIGLVGVVGKSLHLANLTENCVKFVELNSINRDFLYYFLLSEIGQMEIQKGIVGAAQPKLPIKNISNITILLPPLEEQKQIARILSALDDKIELNRRINENLEQQAQAFFKHWFVENVSDEWLRGIASDFYNITIGKTPPRKEQQWFTTNKQDVAWVSIADMGNSNVYIDESSEYLTCDAVDKFNIVVVPDNTVILSFKLTIGRIAITNGQMTTNEAIAHFKTRNDELVEYTYLYLKNYNFASLGSTSSIATAINSKIVKSMPWIMPDEKTLRSFHLIVKPLFNVIKKNINENKRLVELRDTLLPKLMNGEITITE